NVEELRAEIVRLKAKKREQELNLKTRVDGITRKFQPVMKVLDFFGIIEAGQGKHAQWGKSAMKKGLEYGLPFLVNRLFFRSKVKAGISSLLGIALGEGAKNYLNKNSGAIVDPIVHFIRNVMDGGKEAIKARKEK